MTLWSFLLRIHLQRKYGYKGRSADATYQLRNNYRRGHPAATRDVKINRGKGFIPITGHPTGDVHRQSQAFFLNLFQKETIIQRRCEWREELRSPRAF